MIRNEFKPGQMMRVLRTGRFSLLVVKGGMENEPQECVLRLGRLPVGEHGDFATAGSRKNFLGYKV